MKVELERTETRDTDRAVASLVLHPGERPTQTLPLWQSSLKDRSLYGAYYELTGIPELAGGVLYVPVRYGAGCRPHRWLLNPERRPGEDPREPQLGLRNDPGDDVCDFPVDETLVLEVPGVAAGACVDAVHLGVHVVLGRFDAPYSSLSADGTLRVLRSDGRRCP